MPTYTNLLQSQFQEISPYDENFTEELLSIAQLFRPFSDAMDEFLLEHGYAGNIDDAALPGNLEYPVGGKAGGTSVNPI